MAKIDKMALASALPRLPNRFQIEDAWEALGTGTWPRLPDLRDLGNALRDEGYTAMRVTIAPGKQQRVWQLDHTVIAARKQELTDEIEALYDQVDEKQNAIVRLNAAEKALLAG